VRHETAKACCRIERTRPHLIGLQEISLIRIQSPGDAVVGGTIPAETVLFDYLDILMDALEARGLDYEVAGKVQNVDVEVPMIVSVQPLTFDDVRLTDFDLVLAREDVEISRVAEVNYAAKLPVPAFGIDIPRGYVAVDARVGREAYRFVSTHLEPAPIPELLPIQLAQAQQLLETLEGETEPVIVVGDFNSPAPTGETYQFLLSEGYVDVWTRNRLKNEGEGLTNAHPLNLRSEDIRLSQRIDFIFARSPADDDDDDDEERHDISPVFAEVVGDELSERTSSGMWPSDHAGVVASLWIKARHRSEHDED
jgi:hypothetical protein